VVICIDGPAASGKSTVASKLAKNLQIIHLNSGALFRAVAFKSSVDKNTEIESNFAALASELNFSFNLNSDYSTTFLVNDEDISSHLLTSEIAEIASRVAVEPKLREILVMVQRKQAELHGNNLVVEGRDAGTVVFPNAVNKFYLQASLEKRAKRRFADLSNKSSLDFEQFKQSLDRRDVRDQGRKVAPSKPATDAILVNTDEKSIEEVFEFIKLNLK